MAESNLKMFVHYVGDFARWTFEDGRFYVGDREELADHEKTACEAGGGFVPFDGAAFICASNTGRAGGTPLQEFTDAAILD